MQVEIKIAIEFLLDFLYDKLPRRRVNLFGDELKKYLILKFKQTGDQNQLENANYLNINFKSSVEPCLQAAAKDCGLEVNDVLECLPNRLRLFVEPGLVYYAILTNKSHDEIEEIKFIYNNANSQQFISVYSSPSKSTHPASPLSFHTTEVLINENTPQSSFKFLNPFTDKLSQLYNEQLAYSPFLTPSPSLSVLNSEELLITQLNSLAIKDNKHKTTGPGSKEKQMFTAATFAQTKFGSTKKKGINPVNNNAASNSSSNSSSPRQSKQPNQKMFSNEFASYIKNKSEGQITHQQQQQQHNYWPTSPPDIVQHSKENNSNSQTQLQNSNLLKAYALANLNNESEFTLYNKNNNNSNSLAGNQQLDMNFDQSNRQQYASPVVSPASSTSSSSSRSGGFFDNSSQIDNLEETLNSYFSPSTSYFSYPQPSQLFTYDSNYYTNNNI